MELLHNPVFFLIWKPLPKSSVPCFYWSASFRPSSMLWVIPTWPLMGKVLFWDRFCSSYSADCWSFGVFVNAVPRPRLPVFSATCRFVLIIFLQPWRCFGPESGFWGPGPRIKPADRPTNPLPPTHALSERPMPPRPTKRKSTTPAIWPKLFQRRLLSFGWLKRPKLPIRFLLATVWWLPWPIGAIIGSWTPRNIVFCPLDCAQPAELSTIATSPMPTISKWTAEKPPAKASRISTATWSPATKETASKLNQPIQTLPNSLALSGKRGTYKVYHW